MHERDQTFDLGGQRVNPVLQSADLLLQGQQGLELLPEQTERGVDSTLGLGHDRGDFLKQLLSAQRRLPGVPLLLFSQPRFSQVAEGPHLCRHGFAHPGQCIARTLNLRFELWKSARPRII